MCNAAPRRAPTGRYVSALRAVSSTPEQTDGNSVQRAHTRHWRSACSLGGGVSHSLGGSGPPTISGSSKATASGWREHDRLIPSPRAAATRGSERPRTLDRVYDLAFSIIRCISFRPKHYKSLRFETVHEIESIGMIRSTKCSQIMIPKQEAMHYLLRRPYTECACTTR